MSSSPLPQWHTLTKLSHDRISCRRNLFFRSFNSIPGFGIFFGAFLFVCLVLYMTLVSPPGLLLLHSSSPASDGTPSSPSDILSLEQIREIVAPTRGFLARDFSLNLGWNNVGICCSQFSAKLRSSKQMQYIIDASVLQASLLNRTLILPSFVYARKCEYDMYVFYILISRIRLHRNVSSGVAQLVPTLQ